MVEGTICIVIADTVPDALAEIGVHREPWNALASCIGHGRTMYPERGEPTEPARALCAGCPVLYECRTWGDAHEPLPLHGYLAGESVRERRRRRRTALSAA